MYIIIQYNLIQKKIKYKKSSKVCKQRIVALSQMHARIISPQILNNNFQTFSQNASLNRFRYSGSSLGLRLSTSLQLIRNREMFRTSIDERSTLSLRSVSSIFCASVST